MRAGAAWRGRSRRSLAARPARRNRPGYGHLAFEVASVAGAREQILAAGGSPVGEIVTLARGNGAKVTWCYVTDPEGNIIELQPWS